eukprot:TRINITY_DN1411_c0_g3_i1.p1 TRINITY_DN1411_c0_g3~~TRINITY_DN1411_c0_g3_i1.p1  ORF type:complete len:140 (-),score=58.01 TRINITY_DN1411_c0_g3_i1:1003-1422(-)
MTLENNPLEDPLDRSEEVLDSGSPWSSEDEEDDFEEGEEFSREESNGGYELLPQGEATAQAPLQNVPSPPPPSDDSCRSISLWNEGSSSSNIVLDEEKTNTIKNVMANISLPHGAIPPWASEMSPKDWDELLQRTISKK